MTSNLNRRVLLALLSTGLAGCSLGGVSPLFGDDSPTGEKRKKKRRSKKRRIRIELWAGKDGRGKSPYPTVDTVTGRSSNRFIRGPITWTNPRNDERILVYERLKLQKNGKKRQLFTITQDGQGLGRVFDNRLDQPDRFFENEIIFPLGTWRRGEKRRFEALVHTPNGPEIRIQTIKIRRLDYTYRGIEHSLRYDWKNQDSTGKVLFHERFIYSPGKGLVKFEDLTKRKRRSKKKG